jgi:hypothetical protein
LVEIWQARRCRTGPTSTSTTIVRSPANSLTTPSAETAENLGGARRNARRSAGRRRDHHRILANASRTPASRRALSALGRGMSSSTARTANSSRRRIDRVDRVAPASAV